jgi:hypothetical protein
MIFVGDRAVFQRHVTEKETQIIFDLFIEIAKKHTSMIIDEVEE